MRCSRMAAANSRVAHATGQNAFQVTAFTAGYTRDIPLVKNLQTGIGANVTSYVVEAPLKPFYGGHPWGVNVFIRFRLKPGA